MAKKKLKKLFPLFPAPMMPSHSRLENSLQRPRCAKKLSAIFLSPSQCVCGGLDFFQKEKNNNNNEGGYWLKDRDGRGNWGSWEGAVPTWRRRCGLSACGVVDVFWFRFSVFGFRFSVYFSPRCLPRRKKIRIPKNVDCAAGWDADVDSAAKWKPLLLVLAVNVKPKRGAPPNHRATNKIGKDGKKSQEGSTVRPPWKESLKSFCWERVLQGNSKGSASLGNYLVDFS